MSAVTFPLWLPELFDFFKNRTKNPITQKNSEVRQLLPRPDEPGHTKRKKS